MALREKAKWCDGSELKFAAAGSKMAEEEPGYCHH
jgi:hypothetical protein